MLHILLHPGHNSHIKWLHAKRADLSLSHAHTCKLTQIHLHDAHARSGSNAHVGGARFAPRKRRGKFWYYSYSPPKGGDNLNGIADASEVFWEGSLQTSDSCRHTHTHAHLVAPSCGTLLTQMTLKVLPETFFPDDMKNLVFERSKCWKFSLTVFFLSAKGVNTIHIHTETKNKLKLRHNYILTQGL